MQINVTQNNCTALLKVVKTTTILPQKSSTFAAEFEKAMANKLNVQGVEITLISDMGNDYICLTDMAGAKSDEVRAADVIPEFQSGRI